MCRRVLSFAQGIIPSEKAYRIPRVAESFGRDRSVANGRRCICAQREPNVATEKTSAKSASTPVKISSVIGILNFHNPQVARDSPAFACVWNLGNPVDIGCGLFLFLDDEMVFFALL